MCLHSLYICRLQFHNTNAEDKREEKAKNMLKSGGESEQNRGLNNLKT
jgi:hypothetical protein